MFFDDDEGYEKVVRYNIRSSFDIRSNAARLGVWIERIVTNSYQPQESTDGTTKDCIWAGDFILLDTYMLNLFSDS